MVCDDKVYAPLPQWGLYQNSLVRNRPGVVYATENMEHELKKSKVHGMKSSTAYYHPCASLDPTGNGISHFGMSPGR